MKKYLCFFLIVFCGVITPNTVFADKRFDFSAVCDDGKTLYFNKINDNNAGNLVEVTFPNIDYDGTYHRNYRGYKEPMGKVVIPSHVEYEGKTYTVAAVGYCAFEECKNLESVVISNTVKVIETFAFENCTSLKSVTLPNSLTTIKSSSFKGCTSLSQLTIPNSVTAIGDDAFSKTGLRSITFPSSVKNYGLRLCSYCEELTTVVLPSNLKVIDIEWFGYCPNLTSVTIPNSVTEIHALAFAECTSLQVKVPNSVTFVATNGDYEFNRIFEGCLNVTYNGKLSGAPWGAIGLNGYVEGDLVYKDSTKKYLVGCRKTAKTVVIPNSVVEIGPKAFSSNYALEYVMIGSSVKTIHDEAFALDRWKGVTLVFTAPNPPTFGHKVFGDNLKGFISDADVMAPKNYKDAILEALAK